MGSEMCIRDSLWTMRGRGGLRVGIGGPALAASRRLITLARSGLRLVAAIGTPEERAEQARYHEEDHREHEVDAVRESLAQVADVLGGDRLLAGVSGEPGRSESEEHRQEDAGPYDRSSPAVTSPCRVHQDAHGVPGDGFQ